MQIKTIVLSALGGLAALILLITLLVMLEKVPAGNAGIKVYLLGKSKGVDTEQLGPGRYLIGWNEELYLFPTFKQNKVWTNGEGAAQGAFVFGTVDGMKVSSDIGISYKVNPGMVPILFQNYRKGIDEITDVDVKNKVASEFITAASKMPVDSVYGPGKEKLLREVQDKVTAAFKPQGIDIVALYWTGDLYLPPEITKAIGQKIQMTQDAQRSQNQVVKAEADARVVEATATGAANAVLIAAKAEAESKRLIGESLRANPEIIELKRIEQWNGTVPQYMVGNSTPIIDLGKK